MIKITNKLDSCLFVKFPLKELSFIKGYCDLVGIDPWEHVRGHATHFKSHQGYDKVYTNRSFFNWKPRDKKSLICDIGWSVKQEHHIEIINNLLKEERK